MIAHLTIDSKGRRGDQPGFDKKNVQTCGFGEIAAKDFIGRTTWSSFVSTTGWRSGDKASRPTVLHYDDARFVKTMDRVRSLEDRGYAPKIGRFTTRVSDVDLKASPTGGFFPSIPASTDASAKALATQGVDLSVFTGMLKGKVVHPSPVYGNGAAIQDATEPLFEACSAGQKNDGVFADMQHQSRSLLAKN